MLDVPLLTGSKVRLMPPVEADVPAVAAWYQDERFLRAVCYEEAVPQSAEAVRRWYLTTDPRNLRFGIRAAEDETLVGFLELQILSWPHRNAELALALAPDRAEAGCTADAVRLATGFAFRELNLHRLQTRLFSYNERELSLLQKLGFTVEGTLRESLRRDGKWYNVVLLGLLARDWRGG